MTDICIISEGTYPYVPGGVSSCIHQLILGTPHIRYGIVFIGANSKDVEEYRYEIPKNVDYIKEVFLFDDTIPQEALFMGNKFKREIFEDFQNAMEKGGSFNLEDFYYSYFHYDTRIAEGFDLLKCKESWDYLTKKYYELSEGNDYLPFIDYFYNWRYTNFPIFKILSTEIPVANIYHSFSTGYAGLLGTIAKITTQKPFLITEHGIYSHEREIEICKADWLVNTEKGFQVKQNLPYFKNLWIKMFHFLSRTAYSSADAITTLYNGNREKQIRFGAPVEKLEIIPNGIDYETLNKLEKEDNGDRFVIGLVGRVVPIKDIKTFIKAVSIIKSSMENVDVLIMGPYEEDPEYYLECKRMAEMLGLESTINFTGMVQLKNYYPKLDLLVLSSISEGQPISILEAFTMGIPCVTTDVGSCRELVYGMDEDDIELGAAGDVVPFGRPEILAERIIRILNDAESRRRMGEVAKKRINRYYKEEHYLNNYLNLYNRYGTAGRY